MRWKKSPSGTQKTITAFAIFPVKVRVLLDRETQEYSSEYYDTWVWLEKYYQDLVRLDIGWIIRDKYILPK